MLLDRFSLDGIVYAQLRGESAITEGEIEPNVTVFLDVVPSIIQKRIEARQDNRIYSGKQTEKTRKLFTETVNKKPAAKYWILNNNSALQRNSAIEVIMIMLIR